MGNKKKFIDKKKSATFQLLSRDTSDPNYTSDPSDDRVFARVDNNGYTLDSFTADEMPKDDVSLRNPSLIFDDAPEDSGGDCEDGNYDSWGSFDHKDQNAALPDHARKEILELGFPDDGYDYLIHLREIKNKGGGSTYYDNPKASFTQLPRDVKLELQEYASDNEHSDYLDEEEECQESLAEIAFEDHPSGLLHDGKGTDDVESPESTADVIRRCKEYAVEYEGENEYDEETFVESSDESEVGDWESILSTDSTLDNHPGKIGAPEARKKKPADDVSDTPNQVIALKRKEKIPVDFLPHSRKNVEQKSNDEKDANSRKAALQKRKPHGQESKEEKKERKDAVKLERREARQRKKEMKVLYKSEAQNCKKVAAFTGPSSIHLM